MSRFSSRTSQEALQSKVCFPRWPSIRTCLEWPLNSRFVREHVILKLTVLFNPGLMAQRYQKLNKSDIADRHWERPSSPEAPSRLLSPTATTTWGFLLSSPLPKPPRCPAANGRLLGLEEEAVMSFGWGVRCMGVRRAMCARFSLVLCHYQTISQHLRKCSAVDLKDIFLIF